VQRAGLSSRGAFLSHASAGQRCNRLEQVEPHIQFALGLSATSDGVLELHVKALVLGSVSHVKATASGGVARCWLLRSDLKMLAGVTVRVPDLCHGPRSENLERGRVDALLCRLWLWWARARITDGLEVRAPRPGLPLPVAKICALQLKRKEHLVVEKWARFDYAEVFPVRSTLSTNCTIAARVSSG
jgi:hypothetical protein